jgi:hypothetical protein
MRATFCLFLGLCACGDKTNDSAGGGDGGGEAADLDVDGYAVPDDCDDANPDIHPDAAEVCDGVDNDCEGTVDVGATDAIEYWADTDGDGYGAGKGEASCSAPEGRVTNEDDCDDSRSDVNPAGSEVCDDLGTDEDCDLLVDADDDSLDPSTATTLYADADADGYGDPGDAVTSCGEAAGYVANGDDCDDTTALRHPGETEICSDGLDNDCNGIDTGCSWSGAVDEKDADVLLTGAPVSEAQFGFVLSTFDSNGDGLADLVGGGISGGYVAVFEGPITSTSVEAGAAAVIGGPADQQFGFDLQGIPDQDGDGYDELVVWQRRYPSGRDYMFAGPLSGTLDSELDSVATFTGDASAGGLGTSPTSGDVNGDGTPDIVMGAPDAGAAFVFYGPVTSGDLTTADADASLAAAPEDYVGYHNDASGDLDGDGIADLAMGGEGAASKSGAVWILYGPVSGDTLARDADVVVTGAEPGAYLGACSTGGDLDGDGRLDLAVSGPWSFDAHVWLFNSPSIPAKGVLDVGKADATITGDPKSYDNFGLVLDTAGDLNDDTADDLIVGSEFSADRNGTVWGYYGPISGALTASVDASFKISGTSYHWLGTAVQLMPDSSGDGIDDLAVGARYYDYGAAFVFNGGL